MSTAVATKSWLKRALDNEIYHELKPSTVTTLKTPVFRNLLECKPYHQMVENDLLSGRYLTMILVKNTMKATLGFLVAVFLATPGYILTIMCLGAIMSFTLPGLFLGLSLLSLGLFMWLAPCVMFGLWFERLVNNTFDEVADYRGWLRAR